MKHIIKKEDFNGEVPSIVLASSSSESKKLVVTVFPINNHVNYCVTKNSDEMLNTNNFDEAIFVYNSL